MTAVILEQLLYYFRIADHSFEAFEVPCQEGSEEYNGTWVARKKAM